MKNLFLLFILLALVFSCNYKEKYQGNWTNSMLKCSGFNETRAVKIQGDSIKFNYPYFTFWNKFPVQYENGQLIFNDLKFKVSVEKDTLRFNDSICFIRGDSDILYGAKYLLEINLPKSTDLPYYPTNSNTISSFIYYGKRIDNQDYSLQLNDTYAEISDIKSFIIQHHASKRDELPEFFSYYLFIDKNSDMQAVEKMFLNLSIMNAQRIELVNDIFLRFNDSLGFFYEYETLNKKLPPLQINIDYVDLVFDYSTPPPPPDFPWFENDNSKLNYILLIENQFYYKNQIIEKEELSSILKSFIEENQIILSLYDLNSNYGSFMELNAIINSLYMNIRDENSKIKYGKSFIELSKHESDSIKIRTPMKHIWNYSIPHYNLILEKEKTFFGLETEAINPF